MSSEPTSSSGLPGRSRPALSELSRETTENDLWNLDDDLTERPAPPVNYPPQPRKGLEPIPVDETEEERLEVPLEAEPPRTRGRTPSPAGLVHESISGRRIERLEVPDEIGDLEDAPEFVAEEEDDEEDYRAELRTVPEPEPEPEPLPVEEPRSSEPDLLVTETSEERARKTNQRRNPAEARRAADGLLSRPRLNRREILGLAAFAFALLLAAIWVLTRFFSAFEFKSEFVKGPDFPIKGEHVSLASADTNWREPVRSGEARDFARREVSLIPVLDLTLDPAGSTSGTLLVIFRNSEGQPVGDSIRRSFANGRFDAGGNATIAFPATDGFLTEGDFNAYRSGKGESWMAEVFEGPSIDAPADQFKSLALIPVVPKLR